jgi:hypothetical protein
MLLNANDVRKEPPWRLFRLHIDVHATGLPIHIDANAAFSIEINVDVQSSVAPPVAVAIDIDVHASVAVTAIRVDVDIHPLSRRIVDVVRRSGPVTARGCNKTNGSKHQKRSHLQAPRA